MLPLNSLSHSCLFIENTYLAVYFLAVQALRCCAGFALTVASRGCFLGAVHGLLTEVVSLIVERGLQGIWASVVRHLPRPGVGPVSAAMAGGFFTSTPPRKPSVMS